MIAGESLYGGPSVGIGSGEAAARKGSRYFGIR
jgi:hypothetical protein